MAATDPTLPLREKLNPSKDAEASDLEESMEGIVDELEEEDVD